MVGRQLMFPGPLRNAVVIPSDMEFPSRTTFEGADRLMDSDGDHFSFGHRVGLDVGDIFRSGTAAGGLDARTGAQSPTTAG